VHKYIPHVAGRVVVRLSEAAWALGIERVAMMAA